MLWTRAPRRLALGILIALPSLPALASSPPEGPACRAAAAPASQAIVQVLTLDELAPERAARLRARLLQPRAGGSVVAVDPKATQPSPTLGDQLTAFAQEHQEAFARLQKTEPELLSNGMYRLDVGRTFLTPLVAQLAADGTLRIDHAGAPAAEVTP